MEKQSRRMEATVAMGLLVGAMAIALLGASVPSGVPVYKFGVGETMVAGSVGEVIWSAHAEADQNPFPAAAAAATVVSSSTDDDVGGAGCESVSYEGLQQNADGDKVRMVGSADLNGTSAVSLDETVFRIYRAKCMSGATNVGDVDFLIGTTIIARVPAGIGQTEMAAFSLGKGEGGSIHSFHGAMLAGSGSSPSGIIKMWRRSFTGPWRVFVMPLVVEPGTGHQVINAPAGGGNLSQNSDYKVALYSFAGTSATITAGFDMTIRR